MHWTKCQTFSWSLACYSKIELPICTGWRCFTTLYLAWENKIDGNPPQMSQSFIWNSTWNSTWNFPTPLSLSSHLQIDSFPSWVYCKFPWVICFVPEPFTVLPQELKYGAHNLKASVISFSATLQEVFALVHQEQMY